MGRTQQTGEQIRDGSVQKVDLDTTTPGQAVVTKIVAGSGISLQSTGVDVGSGDVTITATEQGGDNDLNYRQKIETLIWMGM